MREYYAYVQECARNEMNERREACSKATGLTIKQIAKLQNEGWAIKEITAGTAKLNHNGVLLNFEPKLLIYSGPDL